MKTISAFFLFFMSIHICLLANPTEAQKEKFAYQMQSAFELQSKGKTRKAFYLFKDAYQSALQAGMAPSALAPLEELFIWYRTYGYSYGLTAVPANCLGEYRPFNFDEDEYDISSLTPRQKKMMNDFLYGVGNLVSGAFCLSVRGPLGITAGFTLRDCPQTSFSRFWGSFEPLFDFFCGGNINIRI